MIHFFSGLVLFVALVVPRAATADPNVAALEFFETHIRPVLVETCYECHGGTPEKTKGGLNLTYRDGLLKGGESGPVLTPGATETSLLFEAIQYHNTDLQMPPAGKLSDEVIARFESWILQGAADLRDTALSASDISKAMSWEFVRERRKKWWSFQPIRKPEVPTNLPTDWSRNPVDAFVWERMNEAHITPSGVADPYALVRRLHFVLTGQPKGRTIPSP